jgi:hypothetical protein
VALSKADTPKRTYRLTGLASQHGVMGTCQPDHSIENVMLDWTVLAE